MPLAFTQEDFLVSGYNFEISFEWYLIGRLLGDSFFSHFCAYLENLHSGMDSFVVSCLNLKVYDSNVCHPGEAWCLAICKQITGAIRQCQHLNVLYWSSIDLVVDKYKLNFSLLLPHSWLDSKCFNLFQITNYFTVTLPLMCVCWRCGRFLFHTFKSVMLKPGLSRIFSQAHP